MFSSYRLGNTLCLRYKKPNKLTLYTELMDDYSGNHNKIANGVFHCILYGL
jgi:hypothetical protein